MIKTSRNLMFKNQTLSFSEELQIRDVKYNADYKIRMHFCIFQSLGYFFTIITLFQVSFF